MAWDDWYRLLMPNRALSICAASLAGALLGGGFDAPQAGLLAASFLTSYCSQAVFNNICDIEADRINKNPSRLLTTREGIRDAWVLVGLLILAGALLAAAVGPGALAINLIFVGLGIFYSKIAKGIWFVSYPLLVTTHMVLPILSGYLTHGTVGPMIAIILSFIYLTEAAAFSLKDYKDVEGDGAMAKSTLPLSLGPERAIWVTRAGLLMPLLLVWALGELLRPSALFLAVYSVTGLARLGLVFLLASGADRRTAGQAVKYFRYVLLLQMLGWSVF